MFSLTSCSCPCCTEGPAEPTLAPQGMRCVLGPGLLFSGGGFGGQRQRTPVTSGLPGCPLPTMAAYMPLPPPSEELINNQETRQKWGPEGSRHLNVTTSTWHRRVKVSSRPCVYRCLRTDLFPDTWAMTWKEFRLQQILHRASMWPLGLNKGKSITLLPWRPWHRRDEERWCWRPRMGRWHGRLGRTWGHPEGRSTHASHLARA